MFSPKPNECSHFRRFRNVGKLFVLAYFLLTGTIFGASYYVDASQGLDSNPGTISAPWKTVGRVNQASLAPGDTVYFKAGQIWTGPGYGYLLDQSSVGLSGKPITFTSYGTGPKPILRNYGAWSTITEQRAATDAYWVIDGLMFEAYPSTAVCIELLGNHNTVKNSEFYHCGVGVSLSGGSNLITSNYMHDGTMVVNTVGGNDDYGAYGLELKSQYNEISYNRISNMKASSYDFGTDGSCIEMYGGNISNNNIHHNWFENSNTFTEISNQGGGTNSNNTIAYNVFLNNNGQEFTIHLTGSSTAGITLSNLRIYNNDFIETASSSNELIWFSGPPAANSVFFENNIVYLPAVYWLAWEEGINRSYNLYILKNSGTTIIGQGGGILTGEMVNRDPLFVDMSSNNFNLSSGSPAIDAGINLGLTADYNGSSVPSGGAPDIGAYEYVGSGLVTPGNLRIIRVTP